MATNSVRSRNPVKDTFFFFAITLGICYLLLWGPLAVFQIPVGSFVSTVKGPGWALGLLFLGGFTPSLVALVLTACWEGRPGLKRIWQRMIQVKIGWRWYLAAVGLVFLSSFGQIALNHTLGHAFDFSLFLTQLPSFLPLILIGPVSEEIGWRGLAQTRLQLRWNPLAASLVVGVAWALWHLPLFFMVGTSQHELSIPFIGFFFGLMAQSVLFAWLHNHTGGSIWTAIFYHWIYTYAAQVIATGVTRSPLYNWLEYAPVMVMALIVAVVWSRGFAHKVKMNQNLPLKPHSSVS